MGQRLCERRFVRGSCPVVGGSISELLVAHAEHHALLTFDVNDGTPRKLPFATVWKGSVSDHRMTIVVQSVSRCIGALKPALAVCVSWTELMAPPH